MDNMYHPKEMERISKGRESFNGRLLSQRQFEDAMAITGVIERRIKETGKFKDCQNDFSNAYARTERFDAMKANSIIRDLFKIRTGVTMNQMREALMEREKALFDREKNPAALEKQKAYMAANEVGKMIKEGDKISFHRAFAYEAAQLATELNITDVGAKKLINESFKETEKREFREWGKELDDKFYRPQIEAEKHQRQQQKTDSRSRQPSYS